MKKCENCGVTVKTNHNICPLCNRQLEVVDNKKIQGADPFTPYEKLITDKSSEILYKIFLFISIIASAVCLTINLMTSFLPFWSLIVIIAIIYCWVLVVHTILSRRSVFEKIFLQVGVIVALLFVCEWVSSSDKWMVNYVIPSMSMLVILVLFIFFKNKLFRTKEKALSKSKSKYSFRLLKLYFSS